MSTGIRKAFYILTLLAAGLTGCSQKKEPFRGLFAISLSNEWKSSYISDENLPSRYVYRWVKDEGYELDITIYESAQLGDPGYEEFFNNTTQLKSSDIAVSGVSEIKGIYYRNTKHYRQGELVRAVYTGFYPLNPGNYIVLINMFYTKESSPLKIVYNHNNMQKQFIDLLETFETRR